MKKIFLFAGLAALAGLPAFADVTTECASVDDTSGVTNGQSIALTFDNTCTIGSTTFSNFEAYTNSGFGTTLTQLSVNVTLDSTNDTLIVGTTNLGAADIELYFTASTGVSGISLNPESDTVTETVCAVSITFGLESCSSGSPIGSLSSGGTTSESIVMEPTDYFVKDISGSSQLIEGFVTGVPEPMTLSLMGAGLLGLGLFGRRLRRK